MSERDLFIAALNITEPAERAAWLDRECGGDAALRQRIDVLLRASDQAGSVLENPAVGFGRTLDDPISEAVGTMIGHHKLLEKIGEGGMGTVWMAQQTEPVKRVVALKLIKAGMDSKQVIARFEAERQALALMDHLNIAKVLDAGTTVAGRPYFVMDLVKGVPITKYCDEHRLTPPQRLEIFIPVCRAVQHAHQKGIIHRDLKPSNVLISLYDGKPVPKVIDFGVAKAAGQWLTDKTLVTGIGSIVGTLEYMSPEQAEIDQLDVDTRSDIYSLGVLLYELLTGSPPFTRKDLEKAGMLEMLRVIREQEPSKPSTKLSTADGLPTLAANRGTEPAKLTKLLRGELDWIVMKALEKDRTRRYATALGLASDVEHYLADEPVEACPPSAAYRFRKFVRRNKGALAMAATVAAALIVAVIGLAVSNVLVTAERDQKIAALRLSKEHERLAKEQERIATENEALARRGYYAAQMYRAMQAWEAGDAPQTLDLLESQRPAFDQEDLRSFEWYYLWRLCHRGLRARLNHSSTAGPVYGVVFLRDGTLASVGDGSIKLWDGKTAEQKMTMKPRAWGIAVSPDGNTIGSWGERDPTRLWDVGSGNQLGEAIEGTHSVAFSPDGKTIAVHRGGNVEFWDLANRELRGVLRRKEAVEAPRIGWGRFIFSPDGKTAVVVRRAKGRVTICRWDGADWHEDNDIPGNGVTAFSPDGTIFAVGDHNIISLYAADTGQPLATLTGQSVIRCVAFAPDGQTLASAGGDRTVRFWNVARRRQGAILPHPGPVYSLAYAPDGKSLATAGAFGLRLWDTAPLEDEQSLLQQPGPASSLALSPDGNILATSPDGLKTTLWDLATRHTATLPGGGRIRFSHDGRRVAVLLGSDINLWDIPEPTLFTVLRGHRPGYYVESLAFSPDDKTLGSASTDGTVRLWDLATGETRVTIKPGRVMHAVALSPDGKTVATGSDYVELWDAATGRALLRLGGSSCRAVAFSPDGRTLAAASGSGLVRLWDLATGRSGAALRGHMSNVDHIAFAPDGKTLATGGEDHTVRLWDTATGQEKATLKAHADVVRGLAFSRDGSLLATGSSDGAIRLWQTSRELEATDVATEFDVEKAGSLAALIDAASRLNLTARLTDAGQIHEEALARLEKMASVFPNDDRHGQLLARGRNQLANLLVVAPDANVRDARRALELARQAVAVDPQSWVYRHTLGVAHYRAGNWTEAATELEKAMQSGWPDWFVSFFPAMSYWKSGRKEQAREAYKHAAGIMDKYYPDSERYVRQRAEAAELLGLPLASASPSLPPAVTNGTKSAQRAAGWGANRYGLGKWFYEQGRFAEAEPYFREAEAEFRESIRLNPESANPQLGLGLALCEQKKFSDAIAPLREAIRLQSTQGQPPGEWYKLLGWALLSIGQPVEAEAVFREQVRVTTAAELGAGFKLSDHTLAWYSLALARVLAGNLPGYEALARQISEGFRGLEDRHVISACLLRAEGAADSAELLRWARQAYEAKRDHMTAYNLGLAHYRAGEFEPALEHIEEARTTADWFLSWPALAMTHHRLAQGGMAREWLDKAEAVFRDRTGVFRDRTEPKGERLKYMDEHPWWLDWTYFEVMLLEARQVIGSEESK